MSVDLQTEGYNVNEAFVSLNSGIAFGTGSQTVTGNRTYTSAGIDSLNGVTLTLNIHQVLTDTAAGSTITTTATLSDAANPDLYNYNYVVTSTDNATNSGYDPGNDSGNGGLTLDAGVSYTGGPADFLNSGATVTISNLDITTAPEPSTYSLLGLSVAFLVATVRNRRSLRS